LKLAIYWEACISGEGNQKPHVSATIMDDRVGAAVIMSWSLFFFSPTQEGKTNSLWSGGPESKNTVMRHPGSAGEGDASASSPAARKERPQKPQSGDILSPRQFERQMELLAENGFQVIGAEQYAAFMPEGAEVRTTRCC